MSLLPYRRKRATPVGQTLERGQKVKRSWRSSPWWKTLIIAMLVVVGMLAYPRQHVYEFPVEVGDVWRKGDLVSPRAFPIFKTAEEIDQEVQEIRMRTLPLFEEDEQAVRKAQSRLDSLRSRLNTLFRVYADWQSTKLRATTAESARDSTRFYELLPQVGLPIPKIEWQSLLDSFAQQTPGLAAARRASPETPTLDEILLADVESEVKALADRPVIDIPVDSIVAEGVLVLNEEDRTQRFVETNRLVDLSWAHDEAREFLESKYANNSDTVDIGMAMFSNVFQPRFQFLAEETQGRIDAELELVSATRGLVREGEVIVRSGEVVSESVKTKLNSLTRSLAERGGRLRAAMTLIGQLMLTLTAFTIFFLFLFILRRDRFNDNRDVLLMSVLMALIIGLYAVAIRLDEGLELAVPVVIASVLLTVFYDSRVGIFGTLSLAILGGVYFGNDFQFVVLTMFAGTVAVFSVRDIKRRAPFVTTALFVLIAYAMMQTAFWLYDVVPTSQGMIEELSIVATNAVLVLLAQPLVLVFERLFRMTTDVTLLELSDTNRDVLRELSIKAPGTFNHSLQVANLSEAAADAIGANALLTRVGALYHDIGKMQKPEYFVENQQAGFNPHDRLKPNMSALIVAGHVRDGIERADQEGLPQVVKEFIVMHHGTARMEYFWNRALSQAAPDAPQPSEADFRYPGPRPDSKETGIVMLADSVEAATRSIEKPTPRKLETMVNTIFESRIEDGQLDNCPLTFAEINRIRETLLSMCTGMHHFRVKYPGQEEETESEESEKPPEIAIESEDASAGANDIDGTDPAEETADQPYRADS